MLVLRLGTRVETLLYISSGSGFLVDEPHNLGVHLGFINHTTHHHLDAGVAISVETRSVACFYTTLLVAVFVLTEVSAVLVEVVFLLEADEVFLVEEVVLVVHHRIHSALFALSLHFVIIEEII